MGTVVFPHAEVKFFLDADVNVRAKRRYRELNHGADLTFERVKADMVQRDTNDASRVVAPLKAADDAVQLDTTVLTIDQVVARIVDRVVARLSRTPGRNQAYICGQYVWPIPLLFKKASQQFLTRTPFFGCISIFTLLHGQGYAFSTVFRTDKRINKLAKGD